MKNKTRTGEILSKLLAERRVSLKEVAQETGIPLSSLSQIKNGRETRKLNYVRSLASFFSVSVHFLLFGEEDPANQTVLQRLETEVFRGTYQITLKKVSFPKEDDGTEKK